MGSEPPCNPGRFTAWGDSHLVTTLANTADRGDAESHILVVDRAGAVRWRYDANEGNWTTLAPADPPVDETGHLFVQYNPGRYDGIIVLDPTDDGLGDFRTLPAQYGHEARFYSSRLVDSDTDGVLEIREELNTCSPNCAAANYQNNNFRWDGQDYVSTGTDVRAVALAEARGNVGAGIVVTDARCGGDPLRQSGGTALCELVTQPALDPAYVAVRVIDSDDSKTESEFVAGFPTCDMLPEWVRPMYNRPEGPTCG